MNITDMMKQARKVQEQMADIQSELAEKTVDADAGGGMVKVVVNGKQEVVSIKIAPEVVEPDDIAMLEDLVTAAVNDGLRQSKALFQNEVTKITGGLRIPGINV